MWKINEVKKEEKKTLKNNLWTLLLVGIFMTVIIGEYSIKINGVSEKQILEQIVKGNIVEIINSYNEKHNITKGVIFTIFNLITDGQMQLQNVLNSISEHSVSFLLFLAAISGILIKIFISNPLLVGENRIYLESKNYKKTKINRIVYAFKKERYLSIVKTVFLMKVYKILWNFTIIGGIIKYYSYKMVTYIIAENPNIKAKDAIKMSIEMMNGNKMQAFRLDLSFFGWYILQCVTFGILGIYVSPYYKATYTELYIKLRKEYIEKQKYNYELLNDEKLYEENELEKYPNEEKKKKIKIDYNKNYELTSIIVFFFIFSFVGWIWEVGLYLFRDGIFVNRGTLYGPWLPIYGVGCTLIILLTKFKTIRKMLKNPLLTFNVIMILCSVIEYVTSWYIEITTGMKYWDYTGIFLNINGRICLECSLFFGLGGCLCVYIVAPFLERRLQKVTKDVKIMTCMLLLLLYGIDVIYAKFYPHMGEGITMSNSNENKNLED